VRHLEGETSCCGVTLGQCHALLELSFSDSSLTSLAAALDLDPSTLSRTVDGLVKTGWVERTPDATDRRAKLVAITEAGEACLGVASAARERLLGQIFGALSQQDRATLLRLLDILDDAARPLITSPAVPGTPMVPA